MARSIWQVSTALPRAVAAKFYRQLCSGTSHKSASIYQMHVSNLPRSITWFQLEALAWPARVEYAWVSKSPVPSTQLGWGILRFSSADEYKRAQHHLSMTKVNGSILHCKHDDRLQQRFKHAAMEAMLSSMQARDDGDKPPEPSRKKGRSRARRLLSGLHVQRSSSYREEALKESMGEAEEDDDDTAVQPGRQLWDVGAATDPHAAAPSSSQAGAPVGADPTAPLHPATAPPSNKPGTLASHSHSRKQQQQQQLGQQLGMEAGRRATAGGAPAPRRSKRHGPGSVHLRPGQRLRIHASAGKHWRAGYAVEGKGSKAGSRAAPQVPLPELQHHVGESVHLPELHSSHIVASGAGPGSGAGVTVDVERGRPSKQALVRAFQLAWGTLRQERGAKGAEWSEGESDRLKEEFLAAVEEGGAAAGVLGGANASRTMRAGDEHSVSDRDRGRQ